VNLSRNRKWLIASALVVSAGTLLFVHLYNPPALPEVMILPPTAFTMKDGRIPDRWIPAKWTWVQKACQRVLGTPRSFNYELSGCEHYETVGSFVALNSLGKPLAESNGVAVWVLPTRKIHRVIVFRDTTVGTPTSDGGYSKRFSWNASIHARDRMNWRRQLGRNKEIRTDFFPLLHKETNDLWIRLMTRTNFVIAARVQLPYDCGLLLLDARQPELATDRAEIEIIAE
jgi:hypothetical protein